jgi:hypothetical protein
MNAELAKNAENPSENSLGVLCALGVPFRAVLQQLH